MIPLADAAVNFTGVAVSAAIWVLTAVWLFRAFSRYIDNQINERLFSAFKEWEEMQRNKRGAGGEAEGEEARDGR